MDIRIRNQYQFDCIVDREEEEEEEEEVVKKFLYFAFDFRFLH